MSDAPEKDQKTHDPSEGRLRQAAEDGNVLRAKDVVSGGMLTGGLVMLLVGAPAAFAGLQDLAVDVFSRLGTLAVTPEAIAPLLASLGWRLLLIMAPLLGVLALLAVALNVMQSGWVTTPKAIQPKPSRLNPLQGIKRIVSVKGLFETFKALVKLTIVGALAYGYIKGLLPEIAGLHRMAVPDIIATLGGWVQGLAVRVLLPLLALAAVDFVYEKRHRWNELKMTTEEVKRESKDQEGDPQLKGKRRAKAREIATRRPRLMDAVLQADVVVTNPTHYAIALKYDPVAGGAPRVLVKGIRKRALAIKGLALENGVPTVEDRPLARALYASVEEGHEIPETLYAAVATILAEVYRKRGER